MVDAELAVDVFQTGCLGTAFGERVVPLGPSAIGQRLRGKDQGAGGLENKDPKITEEGSWN